MDIGIKLESTSLNTLTTHLNDGEFSSVDLCEAYLSRIEAFNPQVNAVIETNPQVLEIAHHLDVERQSGHVRSPLHGLPILLKDNIGTADMMSTTAGSLALQGFTPVKDAFIVQCLRNAGAIVLGKSNLSEWANFRSTKSSSGWSSRGGQTRNAYSLEHSPGGSSSGAGVGVSMGLCAAAVGTETDGSIVIPASMNSIVGIKPSLGRLSRSGIIPLGHSHDTPGPMANCVQDAALMLMHMIGTDPEDVITIHPPSLPSDLLSLDKMALQGARIGMIENYRGLAEGIDSIIEDVIYVLRECGAEVIEGIKLEGLDEVNDHITQIMLYEFKHNINKYLSHIKPRPPVEDLYQVINFNENNAKTVMPHFGQEYFYAAQEKGGLNEKQYLNALSRVKQITGKDGIDKIMSKYRLDALAARTIGPPWKIDLVNGDNVSPCASTWAAQSGYPSICVPAGYTNGLPIGLLFFAEEFSEKKLINFAYAFEQKSKVHHPPSMSVKN